MHTEEALWKKKKKKKKVEGIWKEDGESSTCRLEIVR